MPKIEVSRRVLFGLARVPDPGDEGLGDLLAPLKGELDGCEGDPIKIELNDTNRPDLWCVEGVARAIRCLAHGREDHLVSMPPPRELVVAPGMARLRPFIAGFIASGFVLDQAALDSLISVQEKLADSFGRKRSLAAIGFHRAREIRFPVRYEDVPGSSLMVPLGLEEEISLDQVLTETEKGREYAHLLAGRSRYPVLTDSSGRIFSFPPVLNSNTTGRVRPGDSDLFCDVTGGDWDTVQLTATILACNLEDRGAVITPLLVVYPYDVKSASRSVQSPVRFADTLRTDESGIEKVLGVPVTLADAELALGRMDYASCDSSGGTLVGTLPPYRRDGIHAVDLIEDIVVSMGLDRFPPLLPDEFTMGRSAPEEELADAVRMVFAGAGFEEILRPVLSSGERIGRLSRTPSRPVAISNPMTAEYGVVRNSLLPGLLEVESTSAHAAFPHRTFEVGEVLQRGEHGVCGTVALLACLISGNDADLGDAHSILGALCRERELDLTLEPSDDPRFIPGRSGRVLLDGRCAGILGELHPAVLTDWGVMRPAAGFEILLDSLGT
jgi:phenylalanyl-tRNA synthetase beta chain